MRNDNLYESVLWGILFLLFFNNLWEKVAIVACYFLVLAGASPVLLSLCYLCIGLFFIGVFQLESILKHLSIRVLLCWIVALLLIPDLHLQWLMSQHGSMIKVTETGAFVSGLMVIACCLHFTRSTALNPLYKAIIIAFLF